MKNNVRHSKFDPLVEEVTLLECNPHYALIRYNDGREWTVSIRQLAPPGDATFQINENNQVYDQNQPEASSTSESVDQPCSETDTEQQIMPEREIL